ncbi:hypothetical protein SDC9_154595 [bioreactor metagenome]|uniref:Uncharacterized protein n=1 Tax=bioreactor metagenome TaxID=1076179 RepID=A0A645F1L9_9ZZZZ
MAETKRMDTMVMVSVTACITRLEEMARPRSVTSSLPISPARMVSSSTPRVAVLMPPAVEPDEPPIIIIRMPITKELSRNTP